MVVAGEHDKNSTLLWVQQSAATLDLMHQKSVPVERQEWFYIPRPCLSLPSTQNTTTRVSENHVPLHVSSASSQSSQVSGSSGQPLVTGPAWLPAYLPPLHNNKSKDPELALPSRPATDGDNISLASSTHFTVVGSGGVGRGRASGCCSQSHRVTALVLTMSLLFLVLIMSAVVLLEMRIHQQRR